MLRLWNGRMGPERDDIWVERDTDGVHYVAIREGATTNPRNRWKAGDRDTAWEWVQRLKASSCLPPDQEWLTMPADAG